MSARVTDHVERAIEQVLSEVTVCVGQVPAESLTQAVAMIEEAPRCFLAGAGRSGLVIRALGMRLMHLGKTAYVVGETITPGIQSGDLLIVASGSGRTASMLTTAELARRRSARSLLFTADNSSPLAYMTDHQIIVPAPWFKEVSNTGDCLSVQPMGTLYEQSLLLLCDSLVLAMMRGNSVNEAQLVGRHDNLQ